MRIEQPHELGAEEAIRRLDNFIDRMMGRQPPGGVAVKSPRKAWNGNQMDFSFDIRRGFFGTTISGTMMVTEDLVIVESQLPAVVRGFVGEETVAGTIRSELGRLLSP